MSCKCPKTKRKRQSGWIHTQSYDHVQLDGQTYIRVTLSGFEHDRTPPWVKLQGEGD